MRPSASDDPQCTVIYAVGALAAWLLPTAVGANAGRLGELLAEAVPQYCSSRQPGREAAEPAHLADQGAQAVGAQVATLEARSSLPGVMSFSWPCDRPAQGCYEAGERSSPGPGDPPHRDNAGRDGIAAAGEWGFGGTGVRARLRARALLQVQRDQHDAQQFWLALLDAVRHASATTGRVEPPAATPDFNAPAMAGRVLSELAEARGGVTLVVDDLHELTSPEALAQLTRVLVNLPPQAHAIVSTRHDVRLGLHQLRLAGELAEIRAADLQFSEREAGELLAASGIALAAAGRTR